MKLKMDDRILRGWNLQYLYQRKICNKNERKTGSRDADKLTSPPQVIHVVSLLL